MRLLAAAVVALVLAGGCVGLGPSDGAGGSTPASPTATGACETDLLLTDTGSDAVAPKPIPERPESFGAESVGRFAQSHERAFAHNHELGSRVREVSVQLQGTTVRAVDGGHRVRVHVWTRAEVDRSANASGEATVRESFYDAHYFVSERTLRRAETERHGTLADADLSESGVTLACWGG